jgi:hypothetical protein
VSNDKNNSNSKDSESSKKQTPAQNSNSGNGTPPSLRTVKGSKKSNKKK